MIRIACRSKPATPAWHQAFLRLLPQICHYARFAFRHLDPEAKQEAVQSVVASALAAYVRLVELGKADIGYATPVAMYAIRQYNDGRRLGSRMNCRDVSSEYAQKMKGICLQWLDKCDSTEDWWQEILLEDRHCAPFDIVRTKLDFAAWLRSLPTRLRRIAKFLANGETTPAAAEKFKVSAGRISQVRAELKQAWERFVGDEPEVVTA